MISDVLSDAIAEIRRYQQAQPDAYAGLEQAIDPVVEAMTALLVKLNTPPSGKHRGARTMARLKWAKMSESAKSDAGRKAVAARWAKRKASPQSVTPRGK